MKIDRGQPGHVNAAIDVEWQLPNIEWLVGARCDLDAALALAETRVRAIAGDARLTGLADRLASLRQGK